MLGRSGYQNCKISLNKDWVVWWGLAKVSRIISSIVGGMKSDSAAIFFSQVFWILTNFNFGPYSI